MSDNTQDEVPDNITITKNGVWRDKATGRFVTGGNPTNAITEENARDYHRMWAEKKLAGMVAANNGVGRLSPSGLAEDTWADIAQRQADLAINGKGYVATKAAELVGRMTGFMGGNGNDGSEPVQPGGARLELGAGALADLLALVQHAREAKGERE